MTVTSIIHISFAVCIDFFFSCYSRSTGSTFKDLSEIEVFSSPYSLWRHFELFSYLFKELFCNQWCVWSFVPVTASLWVFKFSVIERWFEHSIDHAQCKSFTSFCSESFCVSEFPYLSTTKALGCYPFKHLFDQRSSFSIDFHVTFFMMCFSSYDIVSYGHHSWSHTELTFSSQSSSYILGSIIIFEFCLATENH